MITKITQWLYDLVVKIFAAIWDFFSDIAIAVFKGLLTALASIITAIPAPQFLASHSLTSLIGGMGSDVLYFVGAFHLPECFAILAAGFTFRMLRKIVTLGQW